MNLSDNFQRDNLVQRHRQWLTKSISNITTTFFHMCIWLVNVPKRRGKMRGEALKHELYAWRHRPKYFCGN